MIGTFADPYPDEIDYSVFARSTDRANFCARYMGMEELFGTRTIRTTPCCRFMPLSILMNVFR
jgi:hypothetical protein